MIECLARKQNKNEKNIRIEIKNKKIGIKFKQ